MLVAYADKIGREVGINGVWGNFGVASAALVTGVLCQYLGWRWAFILPGAASVAVGAMFLALVADERVSARAGDRPPARVSSSAMRRVIAALAITIVASSTTFNAITVALPKLFTERLTTLTDNTAWIGVIAAAVYVFGALAQYTIGHLLDRGSLKSVFLPVALMTVPLLVAAASLSGLPLVAVCIGIVVAVFGQVTINDAMVAKYTSDEWRARAYAARYFLGFTAAGASVALVAWLHERGGFSLMLQAFGALCVLVIVGALIFPNDRPRIVQDAGLGETPRP
jgi:MFS family permease